MCGIAGYVTLNQAELAVEWANSAHGLLAHRGPDDFSQASLLDELKVGRSEDLPVASPVRLVHSRLSIIDLSSRGRQPMVSANGRYVIVFNGEIYNYKELRAKLPDVAFQSDSDTEVLLEAWSKWGASCLPMLVGMFAFAILDVLDRRIVLARDPAGIKPLYWVDNSAGFAFCSEIAPLLEWPGIDATADPQGVVDYLRFGFTDHREQTLFSQVRQVWPGTWMEVDIDQPCARTHHVFWAPAIRETLRAPKEVAADQLRSLLLESIDLHLRADVPVAACLSGGIDSSAIVMLMREVAGPTAEIHTFGHLAPNTAFDEERWMDMVAEASGAIPHKLSSNPAELVQDFQDLVRVQEQPFSTTSVYAQYRLMRAVHEAGLKVTLDGQGADELFGGYGFHIGARLGSLLRRGRVYCATRLLLGAQGQASTTTREQFENMTDYWLAPNLRRFVRNAAGKTLMPEWLNSEWCGMHGVLPDPYRTSSSRDLLRESMVRSLKGPGLPHLLRYEDRNSMAFSVESRVPYLTPPLIDFALSLPEHYLVSETGETKTLLRQALRGLVPEPILDRRDKVAFQTPEQQWLEQLTPWVIEMLQSDAAKQVSAIDVERALEHLDDGARPHTLWRWVNLIQWTQEFQVTYP